MQLSDFDYDLPKKLIAQKAITPRDSARLLIVNDSGSDNLEDKYFYDIIEYLLPGDVLVLNSTKVIEAKLVGKKSTGSSAEIILTKKISELEWYSRIKTRNPLVGQRILLKKGYVDIMGKKDDEFIIKINSINVLNEAILPNPPYIHRRVSDSEYQTVYAKDKGSLAAPTAGLHFTKRLLERIKKKGVGIAFVTLHVGYGTFLPITDDIITHKTEPEYFEISEECADMINNRKERLIVVGTTTLKTLESSSENNKILSKRGFSDRFIYPGYKFTSGTDILVTNFHLPKSSLIMLTCAFGGQKKVLDAYKHAVMQHYRFFSLGDAMMLHKK